MTDAERLNEMRVAARAKIDACESLSCLIASTAATLAKVPRTAGTRALLMGFLADLHTEQAAATVVLADVYNIVGEATK